MNFVDFSDSIAKIKNLPLPGHPAHFEMAPEMRVRELEHLGPAGKRPRKAGVLALFYPGPGAEANLLLIRRPAYPGVHSDQVSLPGGKMERTDRDLMYTALREAEEEVGVPPGEVSVIRPLSPLYIPPSNFEVSPFLGMSPGRPAFRKQESEVAALIEVPLSHLLSDDYLVTRRMTTSYARDIEVPAFLLEGHVVWGATAMMLNELKRLLKAVF
ncbi:CoA pyrophosphatase [Robiginitalea sp. SC105]|uniref:NUDIX hydrolase n=1 Tax=Robiginitalea sp. SC105 TaxID=2762332 RepID=UPI00163B40F3|nr:CoA pyrophosphatase [Robiginitalea sp. SC105]MBC2840177.1 CoA pyrophosphatase [Robiginitalea sp. SC105]